MKTPFWGIFFSLTCKKTKIDIAPEEKKGKKKKKKRKKEKDEKIKCTFERGGRLIFVRDYFLVARNKEKRPTFHEKTGRTNSLQLNNYFVKPQVRTN